MLYNILKHSFIILLSITIVLVISEYKIRTLLKSEKEISLPNLIGLDILDAFEKLEEINKNLRKPITVEIIPILNNHPIKYLIVKQYPYPKNITIKEGQQIQLMVSKGDLTPRIKNYIGLPITNVKTSLFKNVEKYYSEINLEEKMNSLLKEKISLTEIMNSLRESISYTKNNIQKYHLTLGSIFYVHHPTIESGIIIKQNPLPSSILYKDSTIDFIVSKGPDESIKIENYTGLHIKQVFQILREKNIMIQIKTISNNNVKFKPGDIIQQSIQPGTFIKPYDEIELFVASDELSHHFYECFKFEIPYLENPLEKKMVKIILQEENNDEQILFKGYKKSYDIIFECEKMNKKTKVLFYINNELLKEM